MNYFVILLVGVFILIAIKNFKTAIICYICMLLFLPKSFAIFNKPGFPLISVNRVLFTIILIALLFHLKKINWKDVKKFPFKKTISLLLFSFFMSTVFTNVNFFLSFNNFLSLVFEYYFFMFLVWTVFDSEDEILFIFKILFLAYFIITLYGIITYYLDWNPYIEYIDKISQEGGRNLIRIYEGRIRAGIDNRQQSVFSHPITYGAFLIFILPYTITFMFDTKNYNSKIYYFVLIILVLINILLTNSRSPILFCTITLSIFLIFQKEYLLRWIPMLCLLIPIFLISTIVLTVFEGYYPTIKSTFLTLFGYESQDIGGSSINMRKMQLHAAIQIFNKSPIWGNGLACTRTIIILNSLKELIKAESFAFVVLIDTGLLGVVAYFLFFMSLTLKLLKITITESKSFYKNIYFSLFCILLGYIVFILATGDMHTLNFFLIIVALTLKLNFLNNKSSVSKTD